MASSSEKSQAIMGSEKLEIFKIIKQIQEFTTILDNEDLVRQHQNIKEEVRMLGYVLLTKIQPFSKNGKQINNFLNQITSQSNKFTDQDLINFNSYLLEQDKRYKIENLISFISELEYSMPPVIKLSVNSVGKELDSLKRIIELEWGSDIFNKDTSPLRHLIGDYSEGNFQYLVMNAVSAKGPYIEFKDNGEPSMYIDGGAGGADISIVTPDGLISVGAATMKTKGSLEALSYETDQVVRHYAIEQFVYDNMPEAFNEYAKSLVNGNPLPDIMQSRSQILSEKAKDTGLNASTKRLHYELMKDIDWSSQERGSMYYLPEIDEKTLQDAEVLGMDTLLHTLASSVVSSISAYSKFYTNNKHALDAVSNKLKTIITTKEQILIDQKQLDVSLENLSKKIDKNLFNYASESELLSSLGESEDPSNNINYLMYKSMHKDIVDTDLQRTDTSALVLLSIAMMSEKHPESIDLQNIDFQRLASTNRDIHDVLENSQSNQSEGMKKIIDVILRPGKEPMDDFKYLKNKNLLGLYQDMVEREYIINDEREGATYVGIDPLNIIHIIKAEYPLSGDKKTNTTLEQTKKKPKKKKQPTR